MDLYFSKNLSYRLFRDISWMQFGPSTMIPLSTPWLEGGEVEMVWKTFRKSEFIVF